MLAPPLNINPQTQALLITRCPSVHGFFMRFAIDVVYLARSTMSGRHGAGHYTVTHTTTLMPWCISFGRRRVVVTSQGSRTQRSEHALELPAGSLERLQIKAGDELVVHP